MNKNLYQRNRFIHLYNPKKEGLGPYDFHYINAYKNNNSNKTIQNKRSNERRAA